MTNTKTFKVVIFVLTTKREYDIGREFELLKKRKVDFRKILESGLLFGGFPSSSA